MLKDHSSNAIVPSRDLQKSKRFYTETLGLDLTADSNEVFTVKTGDTLLNVYRSKEAGTNRANAVVWDCGDDIEDIVSQLRARGVRFEHYTDLGMEMDGDLHVRDGFKAAWFKDPDGNILHINNM